VSVRENWMGLGGDEVTDLYLAGLAPRVGDVHSDDEVRPRIDLADLEFGFRRLVDGEVVEDPLGDHH